MGATMSLLRIQDDLATVGNVGDSRVYISRDSVFQQLTRDDSVVSNLIDQGQITREEAKTHPMRNVLTLALGLTEDVAVQLIEFPLRVGDRLLLSSDGLHGPLDDEEIKQLLRREADPDLAVKALVAAAIDRGGPDNVSCIVIHCR
jgi:protein phosphatase